ncbi:MAG: PQQ-dependent sugar dehydrogenase [Candidatus Kapabacteria bacterium]|nr:PQQ-dependent sugar dehydrogenase [Candidatus Kapabacteria bacterium]
MVRSILLLCALLTLTVVSTAQRSITLPGKTVVNIRLVAENLEHPAVLTQQADGMLWVTERTSGKVLRINPGTGASTSVLEKQLSVSPQDPSIKGGLFGISLHPSFDNGMPYVFISSTTADNSLIVEKYRFIDGRLMEPQVLFTAKNVPHDLGLTLEALADNTLLVCVASFDNMDPITLSNVNGKIIRMTFDGDAVPTNPMYDAADPRSARSYIYTWGHRNPLGLTQVPMINASMPGAVFSSECGPYSFDELNRIQPGGNYGWLVDHGYTTTPSAGLTCPLATLNQGPSGIAYYSSSAIPEWTNSLLVGTLRGNGMVIAELTANGAVSNIDPSRPSDDVMVLSNGRLIDLTLGDGETRISDVSVSADGRVFVALSDFGDVKNGRILAIENPAVHGPLAVDDGNLTASTGFRYGPNPVADVLTVSLDTPFTSAWSASIVDLNGRTATTASYSSATTQVTLSTSNLSAGAYMLVVKDAATTRTVTFIR